MVIENADVVFCRDVPVGGATYTNEIHKNLGMSLEEAESLKMSFSQQMEAPEEVGNIIQNTHDIISDEISGSVEFYLNTSSVQQIDQYFVTGGCSRTPGLLEHLSKHFNNCQRMNPFMNIGLNAKRFDQSYIEQIQDFAPISMGLGMRKVGDS